MAPTMLTSYGLTLKIPPSDNKIKQRPLSATYTSVADDRILTAEEILKRSALEAELLTLWVEEFGGHFRSHSTRGANSEKGRSGVQQLHYLKQQNQEHFKDLVLDGDSRPWTPLLSSLVKRGLVSKTKYGYFPSKLSFETRRLAVLQYEQRMEHLRKRAPELVDEIEKFVSLYKKFGSRCERRYFQKGSVDGLAPTTAHRRLVNESHVISKKISNAFGLPNLSGAGNILLEDVGVNQARAGGLIFSRIGDDNKIRYNVPYPNRVSYHIQKLHDKEIELPRELHEVLIAAIRLGNHLEDFVAATSKVSPEQELYNAMTNQEETEAIVSLSDQSQEKPDVNF